MRLSVCLSLMTLLALPLAAQREPLPLPTIDARKVGRTPGATADPSRNGPLTEAERDLRRRYPNLVLSWDVVTGTPRSVYTFQGFLTESSDSEPTAVIRGFLEANRELYGLTPQDLESLVPVRRSRSAGSPALRQLVRPVHLMALDQRREGRQVYPASLVGAVDARGRLVSLSGEVVPGLDEAVNADEPELTARQALDRAAASVGAAFVPSRHPLIQPPKGPERRQTFAGGGVFGADVPLRLVYFVVSRGSVRLAWEATLGKADDLFLYQVMIDAVTGEVLYRVSLTNFDTPRWRVFAEQLSTPATDPREHMRLQDNPAPFSPGPPAPTGLQGTPVPSQIVQTNGLPAASVQGWIPDGGMTTTGNNVQAYVVLSSNGVVDPEEQPDATMVDVGGTPTRTFDFPSDLTVSPTTQANRDAAITNFFFVANWFHDRTFQLGFDEEAGNFQDVNFSGTGVGGDRLNVSVREISDSNGSAGTTAADGTCCPYISLRLFGGADPDRSPAVDQDVVLHELTHGLHQRLVAGPNVQGFTEYPAIGVAEGYADWYAISLLSTPLDDPAGVRAFVGWSTHRMFHDEELISGFPFTYDYQDNYTYGIRRFPYSTTLARSPLTLLDMDYLDYSAGGVARNPFDDAYDAYLIAHSSLPFPVPTDSPHRLGEIWALALWHVRARLITDLGWADGSELALQLVTDSNALLPQNPTFIEARDALLLADKARTGGANLCRIWAGFAERGFGIGAWLPAYDVGHTLGAIEDYSPGSSPECRPLLDFTLVLDFSDSMNDVEACDAPPQDVKIDVLKQAVPAFLNAWEPFAVPGDRIGIMYFDSDAHPQSTPLLKDFLTNKAALLADVAARPTGIMTALGPGVLLAADSFDNRVRKHHMVVLSDGMQNVSPQIVSVGDPDGDGVNEHHVVNVPSFFTSPTVPEQPGTHLESFGAPMHTLSIGSAPGTVYDELLAAVAEETGGLHQHTCVPQVELESFLANSLVEALKGDTVELVGYETGSLAGDSRAEHRFPINGSATRAAFLLSWSGGSGEDLVLRVYSPDGQELSIAPYRTGGASFERVALQFPLFLGHAPLAFAGDWRVVVERRSSGSPVLYRTYLLVDDAALEYDLSIRPSLLQPGMPLPLRARVTEASRALSPKTVRATVLRPRTSVGNLLREAKITEADRLRIAKELTQRELLVSPLAATWEAAFRKNLSLLQPLAEEVELFDDGLQEHGDEKAGDGTYSALYRETKVPGEYQVRFEVAGDSPLHGPYQRTKTTSATVAIQEVPETEVDIKVIRRWWQKSGRVQVTVTPRDRFGSYLGPGYADRLQIKAPGAKALGPLNDRLDGTYTQELWQPRVREVRVEVRMLDPRMRR